MFRRFFGHLRVMLQNFRPPGNCDWKLVLINPPPPPPSCPPFVYTVYSSTVCAWFMVQTEQVLWAYNSVCQLIRLPIHWHAIFYSEYSPMCWFRNISISAQPHVFLCHRKSLDPDCGSFRSDLTHCRSLFVCVLTHLVSWTFVLYRCCDIRGGCWTARPSRHAGGRPGQSCFVFFFTIQFFCRGKISEAQTAPTP